MTIMLGFLIAILIIALMANLVRLSHRHNHLHYELNKAYADLQDEVNIMLSRAEKAALIAIVTTWEK